MPGLELDSALLTVAVGSGLIGAFSGSFGCFAYLRKQALVGDVVSHAALLGIGGAFLLSHLVTGEGSKALHVIAPGAIVAGFLALVFARFVRERTRVKDDAALGVMLALFFGGGLFLLRFIQSRSPAIPGHAGLEDTIFGMAAAMTRGDVIAIAVLGALGVGALALLWKELHVFTFDPEFAASLGLRTRVLDLLLMALIVLGIVVGVQSVGVILMIALLVTPASAARQWTRRLLPMVLLSAAFGAFSGAAGALLSATELRVPTGPVVVLVATAIFVVSILFAPRRGALARMAARRAGDGAEAAP